MINLVISLATCKTSTHLRTLYFRNNNNNNNNSFAALVAAKINEPANTSHDGDQAALPMWQRSEGQQKSSRESSSKTNTNFRREASPTLAVGDAALRLDRSGHVPRGYLAFWDTNSVQYE